MRKIDSLGIVLVLSLECALILFWFLGSTTSISQASGNVFCVSSNGGTFPNCSQVFTTIQDAVDAASGGEEIRVATGIYTDTHVRCGVIEVACITTTLTLRGGYSVNNGFAIPPDPVANPTILDAQGQPYVLYIVGDISPTIEGLHITGGSNNGISVLTATAIITNNWIFGNQTSGFGGGIYLYSSAALLNGNVISGNQAGNGGGIYLRYSPAILVGNTINNNNASFSGGGLFLWYSDAVLRNNVVISNNAQSGSGLALTVSAAVLDSNLISSNKAFWKRCGGLKLSASDATLINSAIIDNQGGLCIEDSSPKLLHTTLARNGDLGIDAYKIGSSNVVSLSNTILVSHTVGVSVTAGNTVTLNGILWFNNGTNTGGLGSIVMPRAITGNPAFASDGYHLTVGSMAIDQGDNVGIDHDLDGEARPVGPGYDFGAVEFPRERRYMYLPLLFR